MVEITNENGIEAVVSDPSIEADVVSLNELDIRVAKKEYTIVGDDIYIPKLYDDAPEWLKNLVQIVVDVSLETGNTDLINQLNRVLSEFATQYVPLNQYTQSILDLSNEDARINAVIETLNSNYNDGISEANAQIVELQLTKASKAEVVSQVLQTISAELQNGESDLGAAVARLDQAIADESSARAMSFETVMASMESLDDTVSGEARATSNLYAYVGYERDGSANGIGLLADVQILQKQNDGIIETVTGTYDVMLGIEDPNNNTDNDQLDVTKEPYASWLAEDIANGSIAKRSAHVGDVYIKYSNSDSGYKSYEKAYKFIRTVVDTTSPYATDSEGFTWSLIVDTDAQNAYVAALNAYDLADDKRRIFVGLGATSTPSVPYDQGDLWLIDATRVVNGYSCKVGDILRCLEPKGKIGVYEENDWVLASSYANAVDAQNQQFLNFVNNDYAGFVASIQSQVDRKAETFYQNSIPTGRIKSINVPDDVTLNTYVGDLWKNTYAGTISGYLGNNTEYTYTKTANGSNWNYDWVKMEVPDIVFDTIDTKKSIYSGNSVPVAVYPDVIEVNDVWIPSINTGAYKAGEVYIYNGTTWVVATKYTEDLDAFVSGTYTPAVASLQSQIDGQISYYFFDSSLGQSAASVSGSSSWTTDALKKEHNGDIAYDTKLELGYWYDRSVSNWVQITGAQNAGVIEALKKAAEAKEAADNVIVSYYAWKQTTAPATQYKWMKDDNTLWEYVGSTWVVVDVKKDDTLTAYNNTTKDTTLYVHNGSVWTMITPNGIVANSKAVTDLNASLSSLDTTVSGHTSLLNTVDTRIGTEGARVETKFAYNSTVNIGGIYKKSGFGLTTNYTSGSGTLADPYVSEFWIDASRFKFTNSNVTGSVAPFTIDASGPQPQVTFNGKVTFGSGQTGTIDEAIAAVVETVAVGDKNINITDNLIPITSLVADTDNSGYQFIGTPTKSNTAGIDTYAEAQIVLDGSDEVYSPYVDDTTISYYYRFGIKGITSGSVFKIVTINSSNVATSNTITITMDSGQSIVAGNWYIIEGIINPTGGSSAAVGSIRNSSGIKIGTVSSFVMPSGTNKLVLGWVANCTISRIKLCKVTADTVTSDLTTVNSQLGALQTDIANANANALARTLPSEVASAINNNTTTINGSKITTGSMSAKTIYTSDAFVGHTLQSIDYDGINGFRLKSSAQGTSADPTIYGAYIKGSTLESSTIKLREIAVLTDSSYETKAIIGASSILSGSIWTYDIYPYNSTASTRNRLAKSSNNTVVFAGNTVNSNVSSYVSYRGWVSLAVSTGGIQSGRYPYSYNNVFTITIDGTSHTFSADTQTSPYTFPCGLTLVTVFTITNVNTGSGYACLFVKPYCDSFTLTSGTNLTISVSNLAGSLIMDSRYGNEIIVYNI